MNRREFLMRLQQALSGMPEEERRRAMEYYENYFDEAGPENEAEVLAELGAPEKAAADILREFRDLETTSAASDETKSRRTFSEEAPRSAAERFRRMDRGQKALTVLLLAAAIVCIVPACAGLIGGIGGVMIAIISIIAAAFLCVPVLMIAAFGCTIGFGIAALRYVWIDPPTALLFLGLAMLSAGCGVLLARLTVYLFRTVFPNLINSVVGWFRKIVQRS